MTIDSLTSLVPSILAQTEGAPPGGGGTMMILVYGLFFAGIYFLLIAPQRKKQKELESTIKAIKQGDEVVTTGGIYGTIASIRGDRFIIRVGDNTRIEFAKSAVAAVVKKKGEKDDKNVKNLEDSAEEAK